eukprot:6192964-Pleurochrysis_carterae.AAC.1
MQPSLLGSSAAYFSALCSYLPTDLLSASVGVGGMHVRMRPWYALAAFLPMLGATSPILHNTPCMHPHNASTLCTHSMHARSTRTRAVHARVQCRCERVAYASSKYTSSEYTSSKYTSSKYAQPGARSSKAFVSVMHAHARSVLRS